MQFEWLHKFLKMPNNRMNPDYKTPIYIGRDSEYFESVEQLFGMIQQDLSYYSAPESISNIVDDYRNKILNILNLYLAGDVAAAQQEMDSIVEELAVSTFAVSDIGHSISFHDLEQVLEPGAEVKSEVQFFRARCSEVYTEFMGEEMLHIPFDKRELIKTERFSIPGLPCLYLGTTSYCCWLEIGTPPEHQFNVSPIVLDGGQKIFNLTVNSAAMLEFIELCEKEEFSGGREELLQTAFKLWILTLVTSFKVGQRNRAFKSEYIIPQLLMLSCKKQNLDGIAYFSKQVKDDVFAHHTCVNLALFAYYNGEKTFISDVQESANITVIQLFYV